MSEKNHFLITVTGIVQGVGFRPFVFRIANMLNIKGFVENQGLRVLIDVEGEESVISKFIELLKSEHPKNAEIVNLEFSRLPFFGYLDFFIKESSIKEDTSCFMPKDIAVCDKCTYEYNTKGAKRYKYPFISCTDCGPRYSIIKELPYDRENTNMKDFPMCGECKKEYETPMDRRFHAQTNCCEDCGPKLRLLNKNGKKVLSKNLEDTVKKFIKIGDILAVKGIGGFHLCCNAENEEAVKKLRKSKNRLQKPLAIMARNLDAVKKICEVSEIEEKILIGEKKPILLLRKKNSNYLPQNIAPNQKNLGVMLPYAPIHFMIFPDGCNYLVMTSGNISGMPICKEEDDALSLLRQTADYFLTHNREITVSVDDSVLKVVNGKEILVRCGRGYAPLTIPLKTKKKIMAFGSEQKSSIAFTLNGYATISQYIGDLKEYKTYEAYEKQIRHFEELFKYNPDVYAYDLNSDYLSTNYAKETDRIKIEVQHHHAHMAGCMAENGLEEDAIGVIYDGTGLGIDGTVWGGEFFVGSKSNFERVGHLQCVTLQGGDSVVLSPLKCAVLYLLNIGINPLKIFKEIDETKVKVLKTSIENKIECFESSSMGRFFDCISALCGFNGNITYDAQAAIEFEALAVESIEDFYEFEVSSTTQVILEYKKIIISILGDIEKKVPKEIISAKFHNTIVMATAECVCRIRDKTSLNNVVLSGGVFDNTYLLQKLILRLQYLNFNVYFNKFTPFNDGGLAFGQAAYASYVLKEGE